VSVGRRVAYPPWMRDGGSMPLRARILRRRAARRAVERVAVQGKKVPPAIERGDCGGCGGWGVVGAGPTTRARCPWCGGTGYALRRGSGNAAS
jgi:hypothetical protein